MPCRVAPDCGLAGVWRMSGSLCKAHRVGAAAVRPAQQRRDRQVGKRQQHSAGATTQVGLDIAQALRIGYACAEKAGTALPEPCAKCLRRCACTVHVHVHVLWYIRAGSRGVWTP